MVKTALLVVRGLAGYFIPFFMGFAIGNLWDCSGQHDQSPAMVAVGIAMALGVIQLVIFLHLSRHKNDLNKIGP